MAENVDISALCIEENPLKHLEENLRVSLDKVRGNTLGSGVSGLSNLDGKITLSEYWSKLGSCVQVLSKEATKCSVAFCKPPLPTSEETRALVNGVELVIIALLSTYSAFNMQEGITLHQVVKTLILGLLKAMLDFVSSINNGNKQESLKSVGKVWACCEAHGMIPKDCKGAVLQEATASFELLSDAVTEAEEFCHEFNESTDMESDGSEKIQQMVHSCVGLAKVVKTLMKKIIKAIKKNSHADKVTNVNELDSIAETIQLVSPSVDNLLCCLYDPSLSKTSMINEIRIKGITKWFSMEDTVIQTHNNLHVGYSDPAQGIALANIVEKLLQLCRKSHFCLEEDTPWLDFLDKALDHNMNNLNPQQDV